MNKWPLLFLIFGPQSWLFYSAGNPKSSSLSRSGAGVCQCCGWPQGDIAAALIFPYSCLFFCFCSCFFIVCDRFPDGGVFCLSLRALLPVNLPPPLFLCLFSLRGSSAPACVSLASGSSGTSLACCPSGHVIRFLMYISWGEQAVTVFLLHYLLGLIVWLWQSYKWQVWVFK